MAQYFKAISAHIEGQVALDCKQVNSDSFQGSYILTLGIDDNISLRNLDSQQSQHFQLDADHGFHEIALSPRTGKFIAGGSSKAIVEMDMNNNDYKVKLFESLGEINDIKYSNSGRYISVASDEQKCIIIQPATSKKYKCRPGHESRILNTFFSRDDQYVATIGEDMNCLIYEISEDKDPQEVFRQKIPSQEPLSSNISGCFHFNPLVKKVYVPGTPSLFDILFLNNHWEMRKTNISHSEVIQCCQSVSNHLLVTSCNRDLCIWNSTSLEKLIVLEEFPLMKIRYIKDRFVGVKKDGNIYVYNRALPSTEEQPTNMMEIQENDDRIDFDEMKEQYDEPLDLNNQESQQQIRVRYISSKKSKADKVIEVLPQMPLDKSTEYFDNNRFLFFNLYGCVIENREDSEDIQIQVEFHDHLNSGNIPVTILFRNREIKSVDIHVRTIAYASSSEFGIYVDKFSSWQKSWNDIENVTLSAHWLAVSNSSEIRIYDIAGNFIRSIAFNRHILTLASYENLLVVVYHQSIPMWKKQMISMEIFSVSEINSLSITNAHVPITEQSVLKWFDFSKEGMLFSQDSEGFIRSFSLQTNQWTSLFPTFLPESKKMWIVGIQQYEVFYWKTTNEDPQPTVRPRLNLKTSPFAIATLEILPQEIVDYSYYLWERYCLGHELARWRIWGRHKEARRPSNSNYQLSKTILNQQQIQRKHLEIDQKFMKIIMYFLKNDKGHRALHLAKSQITTIQIGRYLVDQFDQQSRNLAIELEQFFDERARELEYEAMMDLKLQGLKNKAESSIEPKKNNPMNPKNKRMHKEPIPFNFSQSSVSESIVMEDITHKQQESKVPQQDEINNPFLKKKSTNDNQRKKEIEDQIQKYGVKKKADKKMKF